MRLGLGLNINGLPSTPPYARQARKAFRDYKARVEADGGVIKTPNETRQELKRLARLRLLNKFSLYWDFTAGSLGKLQTALPIGEDLFATTERDSPKSIFNRDGIIQQIGTNQPPLTFNQDRGIWGIKPESQATNLLQRSEEFDNAYWGKVGGGTGLSAVVTPNTSVAPDGSMTADTVVLDRGVGNTSSDISTIASSGISVTSGVTYAGSVWLKATSASDIGKQVAVRHAKAVEFTVITLTANWVRYSIIETPTSSALRQFVVTNRGGIVSNNQVSCDIWGAQLETDSTATCYVPSGGSTATRSPDNISITAPDKIGQQEGFIYAEVDYTIPKTSHDILSIGIQPNRIVFNVNNDTLRIITNVDSSTTQTLEFGNPLVSGFNKIVGVYEFGQFVYYVNGVKLTPKQADGFNYGLLSDIFIGSRTGTTNHFNDTIYRIGIGKEALTDEEAQQLTTL